MRSAATIVLILGLWVNPRSWEGWKQYYEAKGYDVIAPAWPGLEREVEDLRRDPTGIAGVGLREVVDHYERIIRALDEPPVLIGHSYGGTIVQLLLDRGLGSAGIAIDSAAIKGVLPPAVVDAEVGLAGAGKPGQQEEGGWSERAPVSLRHHQHPR